jgi:hypothetical protein
VRQVPGGDVRAIADVNAEAVLNGTVSFEAGPCDVGRWPAACRRLVETRFVVVG